MKTLVLERINATSRNPEASSIPDLVWKSLISRSASTFGSLSRRCLRSAKVLKGNSMKQEGPVPATGFKTLHQLTLIDTSEIWSLVAVCESDHGELRPSPRQTCHWRGGAWVGLEGLRVHVLRNDPLRGWSFESYFEPR